MRHILTAIALGTIAMPALADDCLDLWFSRNAMFNDAGYCFGSPLGQALFDNSDCMTSDPQLTPINAQVIGKIKEEEQSLDCTIDTTNVSVDTNEIMSFPMRWQVETQPVAGPSEFTEFACFGFLQDRVAVRTSPTSGAELLGWINTGSDYRTNHQDWGKWSFVTVDEKFVGWADLSHLPWDYDGVCEVAAG